MYKSLLLFLLLVVVIPSVIYAGTRDPNVKDTKYVSYGDTFKCVGKIYGAYKDETQYSASAIVIDDHHLLTAAHVINNAETIIFTIDNIEIFTIMRVVVPEEFEMNKFNNADIALAYSEKSFNLNEYPELYEDNDESGKECSISGYGFTGTFISGGNFCDNKKRAGKNIIIDINKNILICDASSPDDPGCTDMEFLISGGDSGGGLFIDNKLAGINSCIFGTTKTLRSKYGESSVHTRISSYRDWIIKNKHQKRLTSEKDGVQ